MTVTNYRNNIIFRWRNLLVKQVYKICILYKYNSTNELSVVQKITNLFMNS